MATIPIEVIVQDAEAPIVPSEDGTNTNITVPDTGTISNNGDTSSSASSIILPAILLVLAIGSIAIILIHKYYKQKKDKTTRKEKLAVATSSTIAILAVTVLIGNLVIPATKAATSDIEDGIVPSEDKVSIVVTRDGGAAEESIENKATVTSTSDFGYKVLLSMAEGVETSNLYLDGDGTSEYYIAPVEVSDDESEEEGTVLADNTWGYALTEDGEYNAVPVENKVATIIKEIAKVENKESSIYYGVNVDKDLPAGTYSGEIEYTLKPAIEYMQDFATLSAEEKASVLALMAQDQQYQLTDNRDQTMYYIARLADGNVWMTQNLDLDLDKDTALTPANTNIKADWKPASSTIAIQGTSFPGWENSATTPYSADPGDIYYYTSGNNNNDTATDKATCEQTHQDGSCAHYHAGNYYNWSAAVASNDTSEYGDDDQYVNVDTSICPAGWGLPNGPQNSTDLFKNNKLNTLVVSQDGIAGEHPTYCGGLCPFYNYVDGGFNKVRTAPLWLVRSGSIQNGSFNSAGKDGFYYSSTVLLSAAAYGLEFDHSNISTTNYLDRGYGYPVRCIAQ